MVNPFFCSKDLQAQMNIFNFLRLGKGTKDKENLISIPGKRHFLLT
jgi:hypothetical protein